MKDRRGHSNQAYLGQEDYTENQEGAGGAMRNASNEADTYSDMASAARPAPASQDAAPGPDASAGQAAVNTGNGNAGTGPSGPVAEACGAETGGNSTAGLNGNQPDASAPEAAAPEAPGPVNVAGAGSAAGNAPAGGGAQSSYSGDDMGWDMGAFAEAGGYDAVLMGQLPEGYGSEDGSDVFIFIDELNITNIENTAIQNTEINLIADDGGILEIGGDFTAIQTQESIVVDGPIGGDPNAANPAFLPEETALIEVDAAAA